MPAKRTMFQSSCVRTFRNVQRWILGIFPQMSSPGKLWPLPTEGSQSFFCRKLQSLDHRTCIQRDSFQEYCTISKMTNEPINFNLKASYLKMKMKRASNPKNTATLSMVLSITISCLLRFGRNLTSLRILSSLKVLRTESPDPSSVTPYMMPLYNSIALKKNTLVQIF